MERLYPDLTFDEPVFDAHMHVVDTDSLHMLVEIGESFGVKKSLLICHSLGAKKYAEESFPGRFVFAKYFSGAMRFGGGLETILKEISTLREEGYHLAKMQSAPVMRGRASANPDDLRMDDDDMARMFDAMRDEGIPFLLHLSDPDTYYATRYTDRTIYASKERDLDELEGVLRRHSDMKLQLAHFAAQSEIHRLGNLARWFDTYPNFIIDTSSARWVSRELSKNPKKAREFMIKYQDRIVFGTDCVTWGPDREYYVGRYLALRLLLETDIEHRQLPFTDSDTVNSGGTFINGLNLPKDVLQKIYWQNAQDFYSEFI
ncbi:MAG: amidohydrolase family protein [Candidatus Thorarchaeota archaeon]